MLTATVEDSELTSDRTLDDDDDNEDDLQPACTASTQHETSQHSTPDSTERRDGVSAGGLERRQSAAEDTEDSEHRDEDWTYPDDNSPPLVDGGNHGGPQHRERRDSGVGSSLTRSSRFSL